MSGLPTDPVRAEHRELLLHIQELERAAADVYGWNQQVASDQLLRIVDFLTVHLLPHAVTEEQVRYPAIDRASGSVNVTATMKVDHDEIADRVAHLRETVTEALNIWPDHELAAAIARQLRSLHGIIVLHFRKEKHVLLPILDSALTREEVDALLKGAHAHGPHG